MASSPLGRLAPYASLAAVAGLIGLHPIHESDAYWHLTLGRAVLRHGGRVVPEPTALVDFADVCVVPEWLWGVTTYLVQIAVGPAGLSVLAAFLAAGCAAALVALSQHVVARALEGRSVQAFAEIPDAVARRWAWAVAALVLCAVFQRMRLRPQAAFLCILPLFILVCRKHVAPARSTLWTTGLSLCALVLLWAQVHGSFVLAPAIFALHVWPASRADFRPVLRAQGPWLVLLLLCMFSSAHGLGVVEFVLDHAGSDAAQYVADLIAPGWRSLSPVRQPSVAAIWGLWLLSLAGIISARRIPWRSLALALLGAALLYTAMRFLSAAAVLTIPLAVTGAVELAAHLGVATWPRCRRVGVQFAIAAGVAGMLGWTARDVDKRYGPLGYTGFAAGHFPNRAAVRLRALPQGTPVFTDYPSGGPLGFWLDGHVRTFVDGRTPLYFDATDFAIQREGLQHGSALRRLVRRYRFGAAVVMRTSEACDVLQKSGWQLAAVDPKYSSFVPPGGPAEMVGLRPCGRDYLEPGCPEARRLDASLQRIASAGAGPFVALLRAGYAYGCGHDARTALALFEQAAPERRAFARAYERQRALAMLAVGNTSAALPILQTMASRADKGVLALLHAPALAHVSPARRLPVWKALADASGDALPPAERAELARLYAAVGDIAGARFHAFRAAARGRVEVIPVLRIVAERHPERRVRRAARAWARTLTDEQVGR